MKHVLTVTLNPCIDRTVYFDKFQQGATNYVDKVTEEAAGKGINVAVALAHIGVPVKAVGFAFEEDKKCLYEKLEREQVAYNFIELPGRMRVNQKLFDKSTCEMTECNERGKDVSKAEEKRLLALLEKELDKTAILVMSGSVPPGVELDIYGRMIRMAKKKNVLTVLDAAGELLLAGCKEIPYLIKPNRDEFLKTFLNGENDAMNDVADIRCTENAEGLVKSGISHVCISLGEEGLLHVNEEGVRKYPAIPAKILSLQGAGDAMVAGICKAIYEKEETKMAEYALRMAHSTISLPGTMMGTLE